MSAMKKVVWIVNPVSRPRKAKRAIPAVEEVLRRAGYAVETVVTEAAGDPARIVTEKGADADAFLVAGGDGTLNEVQGALPDRAVPVGIIPLGTSNVLAREVGIPFDPADAARAFAGGRVRSYDMGLLGTTKFLLMASYGFDAFAVKRVSLRIKKALGRSAYFVSGVASMPFYNPEPIEIIPLDFDIPDGKADDIPDGAREPIRATFALFCNAKRYAGDYVAAPDAVMDDGLLDVVCWTKAGRLGAVAGVARLFLGKLAGSRYTVTFRASRVAFKSSRPEYFQIDGDPADGRSGSVAIERDAYRLVIPSRS